MRALIVTFFVKNYLWYWRQVAAKA